MLLACARRRRKDVPKEKLRACVLALLCWEHVRASRGGFSVEALGPWMLTVLLHAVNASATSMDALGAVTHVVLSAEHSRKFLEMVANVIELSYQYWWPGQQIGFATDNYNEEKSYYHQSLAKKNTAETNRLQQACAPLEPSRGATRHTHAAAAYGDERRACPWCRSGRLLDGLQAAAVLVQGPALRLRLGGHAHRGHDCRHLWHVRPGRRALHRRELLLDDAQRVQLRCAA